MKNMLVVGAGRFGLYTCKKLNELGHQVLLIDREEERLRKAMPYASCAQIGNSTDPEFMKTLGIPDFDLCVVAIGDDFMSSLETTYILHEQGARRVVSRATTAQQEKFLLRNGADEVVFPERELGTWTAIRFSSDSIENYIDLMEGYAIFELAVPPEWDGKKVGNLSIRSRYGINILGVRNGKMNMDIDVDTVLRSGQTMLVLGRTDAIRKQFCR